MKKVNLIGDPKVNLIILKNGYKELKILKNNQDDLLFGLSQFQGDATFTPIFDTFHIYRSI